MVIWMNEMLKRFFRRFTHTFLLSIACPQFFTPTGQPSGLGEYVLLEYQLQYDFWWVWLGLGFIIVVWTVMMFIPPMVFEALAEPRKQLVISDDNPFEPKSLTQVRP